MGKVVGKVYPQEKTQPVDNFKTPRPSDGEIENKGAKASFSSPKARAKAGKGR